MPLLKIRMKGLLRSQFRADPWNSMLKRGRMLPCWNHQFFSFLQLQYMDHQIGSEFNDIIYFFVQIFRVKNDLRNEHFSSLKSILKRNNSTFQRREVLTVFLLEKPSFMRVKLAIDNKSIRLVYYACVICVFRSSLMQRQHRFSKKTNTLPNSTIWKMEPLFSAPFESRTLLNILEWNLVPESIKLPNNPTGMNARHDPPFYFHEAESTEVSYAILPC